MMRWPEEYDKYTTPGWYIDENGKTISQDGLHISADAPEEVKKYFRETRDAWDATDFVHPPIIIH